MVRRPAFRPLLVMAAALIVSSCIFFRPTTTRRTELVLGTPCTITVFQRNAGEIVDRAFEELRRLDAIFNVHADESEISGLNASAGTSMIVSDELYEVLKTGVAFGQVTGGAFDITIGPLVELWGIGDDSVMPPRVPDARAVEDALSRVDYTNVLLLDHSHEVLLREEGMRIDLGAIAKGYAADRIRTLLEERGVRRAILDFGGNVYVIGEKDDGTAWRIGVQSPDDPRGNFLGVAEMRDLAAVTSGDYERFFELNGVRYHHILDPLSGYPAETGLLSVTILAESAMTADALSTAVFVLGPAEGLTLVENFAGVEAVLVMAGNRVMLSSGADGIFQISDTRYSIVDGIR